MVECIELTAEIILLLLTESEKRIAAECGTESLPTLLASKEEAVAELREYVKLYDKSNVFSAIES
jgi:hypothetical protein